MYIDFFSICLLPAAALMTSSFIGKNIIGIRYWRATHDERQNECPNEDRTGENVIYTEDGSIIYISILLEGEEDTPLIITCWNCHNGYYPHDCIINWDLNINGIKNVMNKIEYL